MKSLNNGDLIAVFDYINRTLSWEIESVMKLEMRFENIVDINIDVYTDTRAFLALVFDSPPILYRSTFSLNGGIIWERDYNYQGGSPQHILNFVKSLLNGPLDRLLWEESRLYKILEKRVLGMGQIPVYHY